MSDSFQFIPTYSKEQYARCLVQARAADENANYAVIAMEAGKLLEPDMLGYAAWYAANWANDLEVLSRVNAIKEAQAYAEPIPTVETMVHKLMDLAERPGTETKDAVAAIKAAAEIAGYTKQAAKVAVQVQSVMVVKDHGTSDDWANKAATQQRNLQAKADAIH